MNFIQQTINKKQIKCYINNKLINNFIRYIFKNFKNF